MPVNHSDTDCKVFGRCGGCSLLNVPYIEQLERKDAEIRELFSGVVPESAIRPVKGMEHPFEYRNKIIAPFVPARGRRGLGGKAGSRGKGSARSGAPGVMSGMYEKGTHKVIEAASCPLENPVGQKVASAVKAIMRKHAIEPYDEDSGAGFLRHAVVRVGHSSGEVLAALVTNTDEFPYAKSFCRELVRRVPEVTTVVQNVNTRQTNVVLGERSRALYGPGFILDELCGLSFRISATSFYQVNARQTEVLYETAMELAGLEGDELVIDAYCGTGTIGLVAASRGAGRVIGVDSEESSIRDARQNALHNGIESAEFVRADATAFLEELARDGGAGLRGEGLLQEAGKTVLFMDPPRAGSTPEFLAAACRLRPGRIVYVSCNPKTQARDLQQLLEGGYEAKALQPVDMFPHTPHIETVALLEVSDG